MKMIMTLLPLLFNLSKMKNSEEHDDRVAVNMLTETVNRQIKSLWLVLVFAVFIAGFLLFCTARVLLISEVYISQFVFGDAFLVAIYTLFVIAIAFSLYSSVKSKSKKTTEAVLMPEKNQSDSTFDSLLGQLGKPDGIVSEFVQGFQEGLVRKERAQTISSSMLDSNSSQ